MLQLIYYMQFFYLTQERAEASTANVISQVEENLFNLANEIKQAADTISFNSNVQQYVSTDDPIERYEYGKFIQDMMEYLTLSNKSILNIIVNDTKGRDLGGLYLDKQLILDLLDRKYFFEDDNSKLTGFSSVMNEELNGSYYAYVNSFADISNHSDRKIGSCIIIFRIDTL